MGRASLPGALGHIHRPGRCYRPARDGTAFSPPPANDRTTVKALWVTNLWPDHIRPGKGSFINSQARSLVDEGVEVDLIYVPGYRSRLEYARGIGRLHRKLRKNEYDVIHAHFGYSGIMAETQRALPVVISFLGADLLGQPFAWGRRSMTSQAIAKVFAQSARLADATITKSAEMERRLPATCQARNHVVPNGVDMEFFRPQPYEASNAQLGWDAGDWNILFVGKPDLPRKNHGFATEVVAELVRRGHPARLQVADGRPPTDMPVMMSAADCLLFPSLSEGSPNTVKEAMAMELPVVSTRVGDTEERLTGVAGCSLIDLDVNEAADAVERAVAHGRSPEARAALAGLDIVSVARRVIGVYDEAIARHAARRG